MELGVVMVVVEAKHCFEETGGRRAGRAAGGGDGSQGE